MPSNNHHIQTVAAGGLRFVDTLQEVVVPVPFDSHVLDTGQVWSTEEGSGVINPSGLATTTAASLLAIVTTPLSKNCLIQQEIVIDGTSINGLVLRFFGTGSYILVRYVQSSETVEMFTKIGGAFGPIGSISAPLGPTTFTASAEENVITGTYNEVSLQVTESFNNTAELVGLRNDTGAKWTGWSGATL